MNNKNEIAVAEKQKLFDKFNIPNDGRRLKVSDYFKVCSALKDYDAELQNQITALIPGWMEMTKEFASQTKNVTVEVLEKNETSENHVYHAYESIIDNCNERISDPDVSEEEKKLAYEQRSEAADKIYHKDSESKEYKQTTFSGWLNVVGVGLIGGLALLGIRKVVVDNIA